MSFTDEETAWLDTVPAEHRAEMEAWLIKCAEQEAFRRSGVPCPRRHGYPEGPNEDTGVCPICGRPSWALRPEDETYGDHLPDCSLPRRHESYCAPGGAGHPRAPVIRGYFGPSIDEDADLVAVTADGSVEIKGYWTGEK